MSDMNLLKNLALRGKQGEPEAAGRLKQLVAPQLVFIVRRVLRLRRAVSTLEQRILAEAERLATGMWQFTEALVQQVAQRLAENLLTGASGGPAATRCLVDTVTG